VVHTALRAPGPVEHGWGEFVVFFDLFLAGAVLLADQRLVGAVRRDLLPALCVAITGTLALGAAAAAGLLDRWPGDRAYSWTSVGLYAVFTVWAWAWILAALALGLRAARLQRPLPGVVGDAAMPFFLVHQPVILAVAFVVVQWQAGIAVKLPALLASSLLVSTLLAVALSRLPYVSVLFGVKRR
jgi:glucans biosynthesis protein C